MANELHDQRIPCVAANLIPNGAGYNDTIYQSCAGISGAVQGQTSLTGDQYLYSLLYSHSHVWRNFGIIWAFWAFFVTITIIFTNRWQPNSSKSGSLIPREHARQIKHQIEDLELAINEKTKENKTSATSSSPSSKDAATIDNQLVRNTSVFTWKNLTYTVKTPTGERILLDNVQG